MLKYHRVLFFIYFNYCLPLSLLFDFHRQFQHSFAYQIAHSWLVYSALFMYKQVNKGCLYLDDLAFLKKIAKQNKRRSLRQVLRGKFMIKKTSGLQSCTCLWAAGLHNWWMGVKLFPIHLATGHPFLLRKPRKDELSTYVCI